MISTDTERREMHATGRRRQGSRIDVCEGSRHCVESEFGGSDDDTVRFAGVGGGGGTLPHYVRGASLSAASFAAVRG